MSTKTALMCIKCKEILNSEDDIFGTSCGHLYHFLCLRECHAKSANCSHCGSYKPCMFKMFIDFTDQPISLEHQTKVIGLHNDLEQCRNKLADFESKYKMSQVSVQKLEGKLKKVEDALNSRNITVSELEDKIGVEVTLNQFLSKEIEIMKRKLVERVNANEKECVTQNCFGTGENATSDPNDNKFLSQNGYDRGRNQNTDQKRMSAKLDNNANANRKSDDNSQENIPAPNRIVIKNYLVNKLNRFGPESCVVYLAKKMNLSLSKEDIERVLTIKLDKDKVDLVAIFKNSKFKEEFVKKKNILGKFNDTKSIVIVG